MIDQPRLSSLCRLGRLLDEAVDLADACGETLLGAQIAQAIHTLDSRVSDARPSPVDVKPDDPSDGMEC